MVTLQLRVLRGQAPTSLYFPVTRVAEISKAVESAEGGNQRILVIHDGPIQRKIADQHSQEVGHGVHTDMSGEEAN
ncbi:hypothetical protein GWN42_10210 [candidate division KSB1 bacterium]|nr:hypothetical protein [candidate division KSB1 bacterium]